VRTDSLGSAASISAATSRWRSRLGLGEKFREPRSSCHDNRVDPTLFYVAAAALVVVGLLGTVLR
jgi:hypothetical protein